MIFEIFIDHVVMWVFIGGIALTTAGNALVRSFRDFPPHPLITSAIAACIISVAALRIRANIKRIRNYQLGEQGEVAVAGLLLRLVPYGYQIFHDMQADSFNVDHIVVGPGDVFAIETKTISKREDRRTEIIVDGESITVNEMRMDRDPITQAEACARHVAQLLEKSTGRSVAVIPVVLFVGRWVEVRRKPQHVWVDNDLYFVKALCDAPHRLSREDIALYTSRLTNHMKYE
jgi:Nuclease-related domain